MFEPAGPQYYYLLILTYFLYSEKKLLPRTRRDEYCIPVLHSGRGVFRKLCAVMRIKTRDLSAKSAETFRPFPSYFRVVREIIQFLFSFGIVCGQVEKCSTIRRSIARSCYGCINAVFQFINRRAYRKKRMFRRGLLLGNHTRPYRRVIAIVNFPFTASVAFIPVSRYSPRPSRLASPKFNKPPRIILHRYIGISKEKSGEAGFAAWRHGVGGGG